MPSGLSPQQNYQFSTTEFHVQLIGIVASDLERVRRSASIKQGSVYRV
jgi:hypothetical protein